MSNSKAQGLEPCSEPLESEIRRTISELALILIKEGPEMAKSSTFPTPSSLCPGHTSGLPSYPSGWSFLVSLAGFFPSSCPLNNGEPRAQCFALSSSPSMSLPKGDHPLPQTHHLHTDDSQDDASPLDLAHIPPACCMLHVGA